MKKNIIYILLVVFVLTSCNNTKEYIEEKESQQEIMLYFKNSASGELVSEKRIIEGKEKEEVLKNILNELIKGPNNNELVSTISKDVEFISLKLVDDIAYVNLSNHYNNLKPEDEIIFRTSLIKTFTQIDFVNKVNILIENEEFLGSDNEPIGPIGQEDIITSVNLENDSTNNEQIINLYFADNNLAGLVSVERSIVIKPNQKIEQVIMQELISGPKETENVLDIIPSNTVLNDIEIRDSVCYVDLSDEFINNHPGGSTGEMLTIYGIVNSLTEIPSVKKIQFLIDGEKRENFKGHYVFNQLFERDENIILD